MTRENFITEIRGFCLDLGAEEWDELKALNGFDAPYEWSGEDSLNNLHPHTRYYIASSVIDGDINAHTWGALYTVMIYVLEHSSDIYLYDPYEWEHEDDPKPVFYFLAR